MPLVALAPGYEISRVIRGGWQMAGGHGAIRPDQAMDDLIATADAGMTTFDCADIYSGVEQLIGQFRVRYEAVRGRAALQRIRVHTKFVPDLDTLPTITRAQVEAAIDRSLRRLGMDRLHLVQFHWWDYAVPGWLDAVHWLDELRQAGKIRLLGGTNFDTAHMLTMVSDGVPLVAMQVQYSLLDGRPAKAMVEAAGRHGISLLCYGTVAGGFLSDRWLGAAEPNEPLENRSLTKYKLIIDDVGGWDLLQHLLAALRAIADRHGTDIASVASAAVLARPSVAGVIVGARNRMHLASNLAIASLRLDADDHALIEAALASAKPLEGDVYALERDHNGRHGAIMKYNLNRDAALQ
jgi:aryl-alcohol dehydrogenase-like predicted oxidoreductase